MAVEDEHTSAYWLGLTTSTTTEMLCANARRGLSGNFAQSRSGAVSLNRGSVNVSTFMLAASIIACSIAWAGAQLARIWSDELPTWLLGEKEFGNRPGLVAKTDANKTRSKQHPCGQTMIYGQGWGG